ncbi:MAG: hypothetical protein KIT14_21700 [bacterium]|nr:hypothetical protein [bacterium]
MRSLSVALVAAAALLPTVAAAQVGDAYLCYQTRPSRGAARFPGRVVAVADRFGARSVDLPKPQHVCTPAGVDGGTVGDATTHLASYRVRTTIPAAAPQRGLRLTTAVATLDVDLKIPALATAPAATDAGAAPAPPDPAAHDVNHYQCWKAGSTRGTPGLPKGLTARVADAFGAERTYTLKGLRSVCTPARADGADVERAAASLACFKVRRARAEAAPTPARGLHVRDDLGPQRLDLGREDTLCLPAVLDDGRCNGDAALCDRRYDQVAYATTHNAMSNADEGWLGPNQRRGIGRQLEDGIRGLMLDTHYDGGVAHLCHAFCQLGKETLVSGLFKIRRYLDLHPQEVVTIIFEAYVSEADTAAAFAAAGLLPALHVQPAAAPWPTLRQLIDAETRLVVFTDVRGALPWHHYVWDYASETPYSFETPAQLSCAPNRGNPSRPLFILNHFLTQILGSPQLAEQINHNPLFIDRARACQTARNRLPNFVTVDFHDIGDVFAVTATLNGLAP